MDFNAIVAIGIFGFAALNALALTGVLWMTRPSRRGLSELGGWEVRSAPKLRVVAGQPDTKLAA